MCLYTVRKKPYVATRDITVVKVLRRNPTDDGGSVFVTPFQYADVQFNKMNLPKSDTVEVSIEDGSSWYNQENSKTLTNVYKLGGGLVYAITTDMYKNNGGESKDDAALVDFKAYIPKGTEYYTDYYHVQLAAKRLFITDTEYDAKKETDIWTVEDDIEANLSNIDNDKEQEK